MASFGQFTGNTIGEAAAFAAGLAIAPLLEPVLQELRNTTWSEAPTRPLDPATMAEGVAEWKIDPTVGAQEAALTGISATAFQSLVKTMQTSPAVAEGMRLIRRGQLEPGDFLTILKRAGLEKDYLTAYQKASVNDLRPWEQPLDPAVLAVGAVRGTVDSQDLLVVDLDTADSNVARYTPAALDILEEASASGVDKERLRVMVGNVGLPMGADASARASFRGILTKGAFYQAILEGDTRPEWADSIYEFARQILTAHDWVELRLRGWITDTEMYGGTALHGMSQADTDLLFKVLGRPLAHNQVFIGELRGGVYDGPTDQISPAFLKSLEEGNERPEWYNLTWAQRYHFPPFFQTVNALSKGWIDADTATHWLTVQGYEPDAIAKVIAGATGGSSSGGKKLTPTQIKTGYHAGQLTEDQALARLEADGYTAEDARIVLGVVAPPQAV